MSLQKSNRDFFDMIVEEDERTGNYKYDNIELLNLFLGGNPNPPTFNLQDPFPEEFILEEKFYELNDLLDEKLKLSDIYLSPNVLSDLGQDLKDKFYILNFTLNLYDLEKILPKLKLKQLRILSFLLDYNKTSKSNKDKQSIYKNIISLLQNKGQENEFDPLTFLNSDTERILAKDEIDNLQSWIFK